MNIADTLTYAAKSLSDCGVAESRREASSLLAFVLQKDAAFLIAHPEYELKETEAAKFDDAVNRRAAREPFQYIVGHQEFYGLDFEVCPGVLIPRPETEILVECAIGMLSEYAHPTFCEIGVGTGCISVSILHKVSSAKAVGVDISDLALSLAAKNAVSHHVANRFALSKGDVFERLSGRFDLIVSNPPYIPEGHLESLQAEVTKFEPHTALFGGADGLGIVKRIIDGSPQFLDPNGHLLIEIGFGQAARVKELFASEQWDRVEFLPDLQGIPRVVKARSRK